MLTKTTASIISKYHLFVHCIWFRSRLLHSNMDFTSSNFEHIQFQDTPARQMFTIAEQYHDTTGKQADLATDPPNQESWTDIPYVGYFNPDTAHG